jgi:hypothetical protein
VKQLHPISQQDLGVEFERAIRREQIVQIDRQGRVADALAARVPRRQPDVAPPGVGRDLIEEQIELALLIERRHVDAVWRQRRHRHVADGRGQAVVD